jgi:hypothetical protein
LIRTISDGLSTSDRRRLSWHVVGVVIIECFHVIGGHGVMAVDSRRSGRVLRHHGTSVHDHTLEITELVDRSSSRSGSLEIVGTESTSGRLASLIATTERQDRSSTVSSRSTSFSHVVFTEMTRSSQLRGGNVDLFLFLIGKCRSSSVRRLLGRSSELESGG